MNFSPVISPLAHRETNPSFVADVTHRRAFRAFNGFTEGNADWVVEIYGHLAMIAKMQIHRDDPLEFFAAVSKLKPRGCWVDLLKHQSKAVAGASRSAR